MKKKTFGNSNQQNVELFVIWQYLIIPKYLHTLYSKADLDSHKQTFLSHVYRKWAHHVIYIWRSNVTLLVLCEFRQ